MTTVTSDDIVLRTYGAGQTPPLVDVLADVWADAHPELVDDPRSAALGLSVPALRRQIEGHLRHEGFVLACAYSQGEMAGFGYAFPCSAAYWYGTLLPEIPEAARTQRLMGLCELAVRPPYQGRGIGTRLHDELLRAVNPRWSSLLALPDNEQGHRLYARLGYQYAGPYQPGPGAPEFDLLLLHVQR